MNATTIGRAWGLVTVAALGLAGTITTLILGDLNLRLPMADGPRLMRLAILLAMPIVLAIPLLPPMPELHRSLSRATLHHWVTRSAFWSALALVGAASWIGGGVPRNVVMFEAFSSLVIASAALLLIPRFGGAAVLGLSVVGTAWYLFGPAWTWRLGFGEAFAGGSPFYPAENQLGWILLVTAIGVSSMATVAPTVSRT